MLQGESGSVTQRLRTFQSGWEQPRGLFQEQGLGKPVHYGHRRHSSWAQDGWGWSRATLCAFAWGRGTLWRGLQTWEREGSKAHALQEQGEPAWGSVFSD